MPSSRRGTAVCRIAGLNAAAKQKVMPASSARAATRSGERSSRMPRASSTSADPDCDEAERLPCLTTRAPAPAATIAAIVEMLTDIERSPPVPTTSSSRPGTSIGVACAYIAATSPVSSSTVSPLARSDTAKPAICAGVASPERISPIAQVAWSVVRSVRATSAASTSGHVDIRVARVGQPVAVPVAVVATGTLDRSSPVTASASWMGSIGCGTAASARDQVASQASWGRPVRTSSGGQR